MGSIYIRRWRVSYYKGSQRGGVGWRFNPRRTMRDQGGREGNASDDALLKTWLTSVNKMDARDVHCYGRWRRPWFRCLVPRVQSSPPPPHPLASMSLYQPLRVAGVIVFAHRFLSSRMKMLVDGVAGPLRTGGHGPLSRRSETVSCLMERLIKLTASSKGWFGFVIGVLFEWIFFFFF